MPNDPRRTVVYLRPDQKQTLSEISDIAGINVSELTRRLLDIALKAPRAALE
jgi:hypothetical protein